jgi:hypothetical protein
MTTSKSTATTIRIRHGGRTALSISYDFTDLVTSTMPAQALFQSLIDPVIRQWWDSLTHSQRSALGERGLSLRISAHYPQEP